LTSSEMAGTPRFLPFFVFDFGNSSRNNKRRKMGKKKKERVEGSNFYINRGSMARNVFGPVISEQDIYTLKSFFFRESD